jgi:hypothetical protein
MMGIDMEVPQKAKNRTTIRSCCATPGYIPEGISQRTIEIPALMLVGALFTIATLWNQPISGLTEKKGGIDTQWSII